MEGREGERAGFFTTVPTVRGGSLLPSLSLKTLWSAAAATKHARPLTSRPDPLEVTDLGCQQRHKWCFNYWPWWSKFSDCVQICVKRQQMVNCAWVNLFFVESSPGSGKLWGNLHHTKIRMSIKKKTKIFTVMFTTFPTNPVELQNDA